MRWTAFIASLSLVLLGTSFAVAVDHMFEVPNLPDDPALIDWSAIPKVESETGTVFLGIENVAAFNLHSYLCYHDDKFWAMWSSGLVNEDSAGQIVRYATSTDGLNWSAAQEMMLPDQDGMRFISRGFWERDGELLALASRDEVGSYFGDSLELQAYRWDEAGQDWDFYDVVADDTINNFPPKQLPDGNWMMSRRDHDMNKSMAIGGVTAIDDWDFTPIAVPEDGARLEEPFWYTLPDGRQVGLFRDNSGSTRLYRAFSSDNGQTWTTPERTDFPNATSKFNALKTSQDDYVLVNNPNPAGRIPLTIATSEDGLVYDRIAIIRDEPTSPRYPGGAKFSGYHYPHILEHDGYLYVIYAENKEDIVVSKFAVPENIPAPPYVPPIPPEPLVNGDFEDISGDFPAGWEIVTGTPTLHQGLDGTGNAAYLSEDGVRFTQQVIGHRSQWELEMLFAAEDSGDSDSRSLNLILQNNSGCHINLRVNGEGSIQAYDDGWQDILSDVVDFSIDANADGDFQDGVDTLKVYRLLIAGDFASDSLSYTVSLSEAGGTTLTTTSAPVDYYNDGSPSWGSSLNEITVKSDLSLGAFVVDNITLRSIFLPGDANGDGRVDGSDVTILAGNWQLLDGATWEMGDFNGDGRVDGSDVTILAGNWQAGVDSTATAAAVPEPTTWVLLLSAVMLLVLLKFHPQNKIKTEPKDH